MTASVAGCTDFLLGRGAADRLLTCCFGAARLLMVLAPARFARGALALGGLFAAVDFATRVRGRAR
ncbi:MAG: hypothetical protein E6K52_12300 [Gammaproteobacteria bacterium]|nr:MAG: hypothetical protein E6K52_12300 [Gammaproteobacteria bacterium]